MGQKDLGAVDHTPVVDVHHTFHVLERSDLDIADVGDTRVVVDLVDLAEVLDHRVRVELEGLTFGDVEPVCLHRCADRLQPLLGDRQALGVDVTDRHAGAGTGEFDRQRLPDARSGTGYHGDLSGEAVHAHSPSSR